MPWDKTDALRHTKKATTPKRKRQWAKVANNALDEGSGEGAAVRIANAAIKKAENQALRNKPRKPK